MELDMSRAAAQRRIAKALSEVGFALPGSLTVRSYRCGKANCRRHAEPAHLHGRYASWARKVSLSRSRKMYVHDHPKCRSAERLEGWG